ncbi:phosphate/phosphite/phosphonate ABC transporter substrate-binding protein [Ilumatobacter sp.]|uniref:phosphate/phosphite/phosphonate ABC transporter substrate-binding protein n=1 Tax=Ilumatobacter sp. TaxID=1967498 RepID=UPI003C4F2C1C
MYDWPEIADALDVLWTVIAESVRRAGLPAPRDLARRDDLVSLWSDPAMLLGQVCSLNPVRDGLGETEVIGTIVYDPPPDLPQPAPGSYYSVIVCRSDDPRRPPNGVGVGTSIATAEIMEFAGARVAANGTDSQSGYWSLGHFVRDRLTDGPIFDDVLFTGAHRESVRAVADGHADLAAIDVHSWRLACEYEPDAAGRLEVIGTTDPTPGVVCVVSWELKHHRAALDAALHRAIDSFVGTPAARRLHISGYRTRRLEEFQIVADQVEDASRHPWHAPTGTTGA